MHRAASIPYGIAPGGWRLPDATRIGCVHLQVAELARSLAWYAETLGLRVISSEGDERATLGAHGDDTALIELRARAGARPHPRHGRLGLYHFAILLPERAALGRFLGHVSDRRVQVGTADHLVSEALYLTDPDGLGIEVYADRPRNTWRHEDRELAMSTDPLDVEDLVSAGGGAAWTGFPAGTVIGHVHLHVGDIDEARRFYHEGLGLDVTVWSYPRALFMAAGGYHHHLGVNTWAGPRAVPPAEGDARLLEWELVLPGDADVDGVVRNLQHLGYDGGDREGRVPDPWGTVVRVNRQHSP